MEEKRPPTAAWNAAAASSERLHQLLRDCNNFSRVVMSTKNLSQLEEAIKLWSSSADDVFREISPKLTEEEIKHIENLSNELRKINLIRVRNNGQTNVSERVILTNDFRAFTSKVREIEILLRRLADKRGLLIPDKESVDNIIGEDL